MQPPADLRGLIGQLQRQSTKARLPALGQRLGRATRSNSSPSRRSAISRPTTNTRCVVTQGAESLIRKPIKELTDELDPNLFWQIHRSTLVNVGAIAGVTRDVRGNLQVKLKQRPELLPVSESYTHLFRQM